MPLVQVIYDSEKMSDTQLIQLTHELPKIIAHELSGDEQAGKLTSADIEVIAIEKGFADIMHHDLAIIIWTADFPSRRANLAERKQFIIEDVKKVLVQELKGFVWILLSPSSFGEF